MMPQTDLHTNQDTPDLSDFGDVAKVYRHGQKYISPGQGLLLPGAYLKWYDIQPAKTTFQAEYIEQCREFLRSEVEAGKLNIEGQLGFVILHDCASVDFLIVSTWRNENELWETAYLRHRAQEGGFEVVTGGTHKATFCVWELGAVCYESGAWSRFLYSARDEQAKLAYIHDSYSGPV